MGPGTLFRLFGVAPLLLLLSPPTLTAQGTVYGRITDAATGAPMAAVQVTVDGTGLGALTDSAGRYRISGVLAGPQVLRARYLGFEERSVQLVVWQGVSRQEDLAMQRAGLGLDEVVVSGKPFWAWLNPLFPLATLLGALLSLSWAQRRGGNRRRRLFAAAVGGLVAGAAFGVIRWGVGGPPWLAAPSIDGLVIGGVLAVWALRARPYEGLAARNRS